MVLNSCFILLLNSKISLNLVVYNDYLAHISVDRLFVLGPSLRLSVSMSDYNDCYLPFYIAQKP